MKLDLEVFRNFFRKNKPAPRIEPIYDEDGLAWRGMFGDSVVDSYFGRLPEYDKPGAKAKIANVAMDWTVGERQDTFGVISRLVGDPEVDS